MTKIVLIFERLRLKMQLFVEVCYAWTLPAVTQNINILIHIPLRVENDKFRELKRKIGSKETSFLIRALKIALDKTVGGCGGLFLF